MVGITALGRFSDITEVYLTANHVLLASMILYSYYGYNLPMALHTSPAEQVLGAL
jgi:hypothetical protein